MVGVESPRNAGAKAEPDPPATTEGDLVEAFALVAETTIMSMGMATITATIPIPMQTIRWGR